MDELTSIAKRCQQILDDRSSDDIDLREALRDAVLEIERLEGMIETRIMHDEMYGRQNGARQQVLFK